MLTLKERLQIALELGQPERMPITAFIYPQFISDLMNRPIGKVEDFPHSYEYQIQHSKMLGLACASTPEIAFIRLLTSL